MPNYKPGTTERGRVEMETEEEFAMGEFLRLCATTANEEEEPRKGRMNFPLAFPSLFCCFRKKNQK